MYLYLFTQFRRHEHNTKRKNLNLIMDVEKIVSYIQSLDKSNSHDPVRAQLTAHLRLNAVYWAQTALQIVGESLPVEQVLEFVGACYHADSGGFGGNVGHDAHLLYTLSAIQVYALLDRMDLGLAVRFALLSPALLHLCCSPALLSFSRIFFSLVHPETIDCISFI